MASATGERKIAVVTGGSRGIGRAVVLDLCARGFEVHFTYLKDAAAARLLAEQAQARGNAALPSKADARDAVESSALIERIVSERGRIDVLVNNAGVLADRLLATMSFADWSSVLDTSLSGLFGTTRPTAKQMMRQRGGRIVNLTSVSGLTGFPGQTAYSAAKAAIIGFTRSLAKELAGYGACANAVAPGYIDTDMLSALSPKQRAAALERIPMGRLGTPEEVAALVGYLAAEAPLYLTGQVLVIDGGLT